MEKIDLSVPIYAEVPIPYTATGRISAMGLELYVRWFRGAGYDGVATWGRISRGDLLDPLERDELFSTWRGGLPPTSAVAAILPFGGGSCNIGICIEQATVPREAGADLLILKSLPDGITSLEEASKPLGEFAPPVFGVVETMGSTSTVKSSAGGMAIVSGIASVIQREEFTRKQAALDEVLAEIDSGMWPPLLLGALVEKGILSPDMAYDRDVAATMDPRLLRLLRE